MYERGKATSIGAKIQFSPILRNFGRERCRIHSREISWRGISQMSLSNLLMKITLTDVTMSILTNALNSTINPDPNLNSI